MSDDEWVGGWLVSLIYCVRMMREAVVYRYGCTIVVRGISASAGGKNKLTVSDACFVPLFVACVQMHACMHGSTILMKNLWEESSFLYGLSRSMLHQARHMGTG